MRDNSMPNQVADEIRSYRFLNNKPQPGQLLTLAFRN
jgi:hypothetical protein